jgi:hypothetical protein
METKEVLTGGEKKMETKEKRGPDRESSTKIQTETMRGQTKF